MYIVVCELIFLLHRFHTILFKFVDDVSNKIARFSQQYISSFVITIFNIRTRIGLRKNIRSDHLNTERMLVIRLSERTKTLFIRKLESGGNDRYRNASLLLDYTNCFCLRVKFSYKWIFTVPCIDRRCPNTYER